MKGFPDSSVGKESSCNAGDPGSIPGSGRFAGKGIGYPLRYSGLENSMDYTVHGVEKSQTQWLSNFHFLEWKIFQMWYDQWEDCYRHIFDCFIKSCKFSLRWSHISKWSYIQNGGVHSGDIHLWLSVPFPFPILLKQRKLLEESLSPWSYICAHLESNEGFSGGSAGKESTCNAGDLGSIPGLGRSHGEGNGYPLQYFGLEVHGVAKSHTQLSDFHTFTKVTSYFWQSFCIVSI